MTDDAKNWNFKGIVLGDLGEFEDAIKAFDEAIKINPELAKAWFNKGHALYELEKYEDAKRLLMKPLDKSKGCFGSV